MDHRPRNALQKDGLAYFRRRSYKLPMHQSKRPLGRSTAQEANRGWQRLPGKDTLSIDRRPFVESTATTWNVTW
jgi:hypothetical protein